MSKVIGIDVSKQTLDVAYFENERWYHHQVKNNERGYKKIIKLLSPDGWIIMEASGPYYLQLAMYMYARQAKTTVVNPLKIKRFSQMKFMRTKTDKKDAKTIAEYGIQFHQEFEKWQPEPQAITNIQQLLSAIKLLKKQIRQTKNQEEAFKSSGLLTKELARMLSSIITILDKKCNKLEDQLEKIAQKNYQSTIERLQTIPGIGKKTALLLTVLSNDFQKFENHKQLIAYVGFSPRIYQSGTSVKGKGHICKMGRGDIRKLLYLCSWAAKKCNKPCIEMYNRLKEKGKPERVIKVALANKLIKQAFAIVKNGTVFNENFTSQLELKGITN